MQIVAVTKTRSVEEILSLPLEIEIIAENKVQEAETKFIELSKSSRKFKKHLIGNLQKNKVKKAIILFDCIQSVDSVELIQKINSEAKKANKIQEIYLQINISNDPLKFGFKENQVKKIFLENTFTNVHITGLMTILKNNLTIKETEKYYIKMKMLFSELNKTILHTNPLQHLSMGMSDDWQIAQKCGSNMIRIGRALFETNYEKTFLENI